MVTGGSELGSNECPALLSVYVLYIWLRIITQFVTSTHYVSLSHRLVTGYRVGMLLGESQLPDR